MQDERAPSRLPGHGSAEVPLGDPAMAPLGSEIQAAAQEHFAALADAVPLIVWTARPDGRVDYANRRWFEYAGMSFDQTRGWGAVLHPDDLHRCIDRWNEAVTTGEAYEIEYRFRRADGVYRWHLGRALPLRDRDGRIVRWFGTCTDIDDQKRAEQAQRLLAEAGDLLASSLDHEATLSNIVRLAVPMLADYCVVDLLRPDGTVERVAAAHADTAQLDLVKRAGRFLSDLDAPEGIARVLRSGQPAHYPEITEAHLAGSSRDQEHLEVLRALAPKSSMIVPLVARGRTLGAISLLATQAGRCYEPADLVLAEELARRCALAVDNARLYQEANRALQRSQESLARERATRAEAEAAVRLRDEFLSIAAHELKTPVTSLLGFAQLTLRRLDRLGTIELDRLRQALQTIDQQAGRLARLTGQLLDVSRLEAGKLALERSLADVVRIVDGVTARARSGTSRHMITVCAPGPVLALVDPLRLEQVLTNLLDNAIKYSPQGGRVEVEVAQPAVEGVRITVRDHGIGIPPERREHLFERYYQAHGGSRVAGLGLGLYVSRQIVELHGGRLEAEFPPDGGTCFVVSLPTGEGAAGNTVRRRRAPVEGRQ